MQEEKPSNEENRVSVSSITEGKLGVESIFTEEVFNIVLGSETTKGVLLDTVDRHTAEIEASLGATNSGLEQEADMDLEDYKGIEAFLKGEAAYTPYHYSGGHGYVMAHAIQSNRFDTEQARIALTEQDSTLRPAKQMAVGIEFPARRSNIPGKDIEKPKFTVSVRSEDIYLEGRRKRFRATVGVKIDVMPDDSITVRPTKYSGNIDYHATAYEYASNHPVAKHLEGSIRALARGRK